MDEITWVRRDVVLAIHHRQLSEHCGLAGVRDEGLLDSALARPKNQYDPEHADLARLAAAQAFGLARNHPFIDGNKRVALATCRTFLAINGFDVDATQEEKYHTFLGLAVGDVSEEELAAWLRERLVPTRMT